MTSKVTMLSRNRKRRFATGSISESIGIKPRKIGKNVKGLKIIIRSGSLKATTAMKPCPRCPRAPESAPSNQFEFNFNNVLHPEQMSSTNSSDFIQQSANFSKFVQKLPVSVRKNEDSKITTGLCTLFSSIL